MYTEYLICCSTPLLAFERTERMETITHIALGSKLLINDQELSKYLLFLCRAHRFVWWCRWRKVYIISDDFLCLSDTRQLLFCRVRQTHCGSPFIALVEPDKVLSGWFAVLKFGSWSGRVRSGRLSVYSLQTLDEDARENCMKSINREWERPRSQWLDRAEFDQTELNVKITGPIHK